MNDLITFFMRMDKRAARAVLITIALFASVIAVFLIGRFVFDLQPGVVQEWLASAQNSWYALPLTMLAFTLLAFVGVPQFVLIAAAVFAFGPVEGFIYSWISTMCSGTVTFFTGRFLGADVIRRYGGQTVNRISKFVGKYGFWASLIVRIVPSAPFIVVNMAAGVSRMSYFAFIGGMGVGVIPKTTLVAFGGGALIALFSGGDLVTVAVLLAVGALWIGLMLYARRWLRSSALAEEAQSLKSEDGSSQKTDS